MDMPNIEQRPVVLVTGSSGLIGTRLCEALSKSYNVVGLDVQQPDSASASMNWIECDLTSETGADSALAEVSKCVGRRIASVVHLAAYYDFSGEPSPLYKKLTVDGTRRLLRGLQAFDVGQFVFSSTLLVMEPVDEDEEALDETSATEGEWDYPKSKLSAEQVIAEEREDIPVVILRLAGAYDEDCHSPPISQQISRIYEGKLESHFFPGDAAHGQPFIHLDDLVRCIEKVISRRKELESHEVFLIAEDELLTYEELQNRIGNLLFGEEWSTIRIPKSVAKAGAWAKDAIGSEETFIKPWMIELADDHYPVNIRKAREKLDWEPKHNLGKTLETMIRNLQEYPKEWYETNKLGEPPADALGTVILNPVSPERTPK